MPYRDTHINVAVASLETSRNALDCAADDLRSSRVLNREKTVAMQLRDRVKKLIKKIYKKRPEEGNHNVS